MTDLWAAVKGLRPGMEAALDLAREFGVDLPTVSAEAKEKAERRRQLEAEYLRQAEEHHEALSQHPSVVEWWEGRGFYEGLREKFLLGVTDDGARAATIPFWNRGRVHGIVRRKLEKEPDRKYLLPKKEEFPRDTVRCSYPAACERGCSWSRATLTPWLYRRSATASPPSGVPTSTRSSWRSSSGYLARYTSYPTPTRRGGRLPGGWSRNFIRRPCCARQNTRERKSKLSQKIKDAADLFAAEGEEAREILEGLKEQAKDALDVAVSEAPAKGDVLGRYRRFKERELPLIMRLEDPGERRAVLEDIARAHDLKVQRPPQGPLRGGEAGGGAAERRPPRKKIMKAGAHKMKLSSPSPAPSATRRRWRCCGARTCC